MKTVNLPQNWKMVQFKDIFEIRKGKKVNISENPSESSMPYIVIENLRGNPIKNFTDDEKGLLCESDDILIVWDGANCGTVGSGLSGFVGSTIARLSLTDNSIDKDYILIFLKSKFKIFNTHTTGATIPHLNKNFLINFKIPIPPLETQNKIVEILENTEKLKEWRAEADELADEYLKSVFLEMFGDLYENENGWHEYILNDLIEIPLNSGWSPKCSDEKGGVPVFSLANLDGNNLNTNITKYYYGESPKKGLDLKIGDILISRSNTKELVGRSGLYKGNPGKVLYPDLMIRIRLNEKLNPVFFEKYLQSEFTMKMIRRFSHGTSGSMVKISQKNLGKLKVTLPPLELQNQFAHLVKQVETLKSYQSQSKQEIDNLFNTLMQKAFKGELVC